MNRTVRHAARLAGVIKVPGDKSISHRALILGSVARGKQVIDGIAEAADVESTASCLRAMGSFVERMPDGRTLVITNEFKEQATLDAGNSGTTARLVAALAAGRGTRCTIDGDESLRRRPMKRIAEPLERMGATIGLSKDGTLPMNIAGGNLKGIEYELPVASAQVKSAILIAGLFADGDTTVVEPVPTRDHTERMLEALGVEVRRDGNRVSITGGAELDSAHIVVPGDFSSAAYFIAAAMCVPDSELYLPLTGVNPTRIGFLEVLARMGASVVLENSQDLGGEPAADITVVTAALRGVTIDDPAVVASVIDEIPVIAVLATQAEGETHIRGAGELRHKESDRIATVAKNLRAMGADVTEHDDGMTIAGSARLKGARVSAFGDHRIAMAMAVAGLVAKGETEIDGAEAVDISYPRFFGDLSTLIRDEEAS